MRGKKGEKKNTKHKTQERPENLSLKYILKRKIRTKREDWTKRGKSGRKKGGRKKCQNENKPKGEHNKRQGKQKNKDREKQ